MPRAARGLRALWTAASLACVAFAVGSCGGTEIVTQCPTGQVMCGAVCVDTQGDPDHCGSCGNACTAPTGGAAACSGGVCVKSCGDETLCGTTCRDVKTDLANCGRCSHPCPAPAGGVATCSDGQCGQACLGGDTMCTSGCVNTDTDPANCGACGHACTAPSGATAACANGRCGSICPSGTTACGDACIDLTSSKTDCGACGHACVALPGATASCVSSACQSACSGGQTLCGDGCHDLTSDSANCGACDHACEIGFFCQGSACTQPAPLFIAVDPPDLHSKLGGGLYVSGLYVTRPTKVTLVKGSTRVPLHDTLTQLAPAYTGGDSFSPGIIKGTVLPDELSAGDWDVELDDGGQISTGAAALHVVSAPFVIDQLDVGQGDGAILRSPTGKLLVIDGGNTGMGARIRSKLAGATPDYIALSHYHADHMAGIEELMAGLDGTPFTSDDVVPKISLLDHGDNHSCDSNLCRAYIGMRDSLAARGLAREVIPGETIALGGSLAGGILFANGVRADGTASYTSDPNENSVGWIFDFGGFRFYSAGDATGGPIPGCDVATAANFVDLETPAARLLGRLDVVKVSHHGSCTGSPAPFTGITTPTLAMVSTGTDNVYCHPSRRVLFDYDALGVDLLLTEPGVISPGNATGCALTERPADVPATYGDLQITVPGDGTFIARVYAQGTSTLLRERTYTIHAPHPGPLSDPNRWSEKAARLLTSRTKAGLAETIVVQVDAAITSPSAALVPWANATDAAIATIESGGAATGTIAITATSGSPGQLSLSLTNALPADTDLAVIIPSSATALNRALVLPLHTAKQADLLPPTASLSAIAVGTTGAFLNTPRVNITFSEPVSGVATSSFFLSEQLSGKDVVYGTVSGSDGIHYTLDLPQASRTGYGNVACGALCPGMRYLVRLTSGILDAAGNPVDIALPLTFDSGTCADAGAPTVTIDAASRALPSALSLVIKSDEPISGEVWVAPTASFGTACAGTNPGPPCVRVALIPTACSVDGCTPSSGACTSYAVARGLTTGVSYTAATHVRDAIGNNATPVTTALSTQSGAVLVVTEIFADPPNTEGEAEFVELANLGDTSIDLTDKKIRKVTAAGTSTLRALVNTGTASLAPGQAALFVGTGFLTSRFPGLPAGTLILKDTTSSGPLAGLANNPIPGVDVLAADGVTILTQSPFSSTVTCGENHALERIAPELPDRANAFACGAVGGTPGAFLKAQ